MRSLVQCTALAAVLSFAAGCADAPTAPDSAADLARNASGGRGSGTTLTATKSAIGYNEHRTEYDWTIEKQVLSIMDEHMIPEGSVTETTILPRSANVGDPRALKWIDYRLVATRGAPTVTTGTGVRGEICVTNGGDRPTEGLAIRDVVQRRDRNGWEDLVSADVDVSAKPVLGPRESHCYPYEIPFASDGGAYRNTAFVTITNHSGSLGVPHGPAFNGGGIKAPFTIPATRTAVVEDAEAFVYDPNPTNVPGSYERGGCAALWPLFFCTAAGELSGWHLTESTTIEFIVDVGNLYACGDTYRFTNTAALTESGTGDFGAGQERRFATVSIDVHTPACGDRTAPVRDVGYWKQGTDWPPHQFWGRTFRIQDFPFFDTGTTWLGALKHQPRTTYDRLAQQYIAATLNFAAGAPMPRAVQDVRSEVGHYLGGWPEHRASVSESQLRAWADVLEGYNESGSR